MELLTALTRFASFPGDRSFLASASPGVSEPSCERVFDVALWNYRLLLLMLLRLSLFGALLMVMAFLAGALLFVFDLAEPALHKRIVATERHGQLFQLRRAGVVRDDDELREPFDQRPSRAGAVFGVLLGVFFGLSEQNGVVMHGTPFGA